tara:strand:+ start:714 stop:2462 length:1749 start_codon:yes stop_codon:yes gene_type:complete
MKYSFFKIIRSYAIVFLVSINGCAYFNTYFNAQEYFKEAEKIRLQKEGENIPISAIDKYGKTIKKCQTVISEYPESRFKKSALLLMAKSQFYREDYELSLDNLKIFYTESTYEKKEEALYWIALCKWKKGNIQASINELDSLVKKSKSKDLKSNSYLSLAQIYKDLKELDKSVYYLQEAARLNSNRDQKSAIYGRLAEMAFNKKEYDLALDGYKNVTAHSLSKKNIENAHLQILKIFRLQKKYRQASKKIKSMLTDDKFKSISGNLELELVQLYRSQGEYSEIEARLETIVNNYQKTAISAEAYFQLAQIYTSEKWNLNKAKEYFSLVSKEYSRSLYSPIAKSRLESIDLYEKTNIELKTLIDQETKININSDSSNVDLKIPAVSIVASNKTIPELYYQLADLEAFKFKRYSESILLLLKIIEKFSDSTYKPKSLFSLHFIYQLNNDTLNVKKIEEQLKNEHPNSEYTFYLNGNMETVLDLDKQLFKEAQDLLIDNKVEGIEKFKRILKNQNDSDLKLPSAFSIAYYYDQNTQIDSAYKYFNYIKESFPGTDHSTKAANRLFILGNVLSTLKPDSSKINLEQ